MFQAVCYNSNHYGTYKQLHDGRQLQTVLCKEKLGLADVIIRIINQTRGKVNEQYFKHLDGDFGDVYWNGRNGLFSVIGSPFYR